MNNIHDPIYKYKKCKCPDDCFEAIVVDHDENFDDKNTIYYHYMNCGTDFAIADFYKMKILYQNI